MHKQQTFIAYTCINLKISLVTSPTQRFYIHRPPWLAVAISLRVGYASYGYLEDHPKRLVLLVSVAGLSSAIDFIVVQ